MTSNRLVFASGVRTVDEPSAELQSVIDRSVVPEPVDAEPADHSHFEPEIAERVRDPGGPLEFASRVAVRPADVLAQEVEHLGQGLFVSELLQLLGARTQGRDSFVHQAAAHRPKRRLPGLDQRAHRAIAGLVRRGEPVVVRCFSLFEVAALVQRVSEIGEQARSHLMRLGEEGERPLAEPNGGRRVYPPHRATGRPAQSLSGS